MAEAMPLAASDEQIERPDGRVELREDVVLDDPALYNEDLAPTRVERRTWTTYTFAALWISMAHCIPTYMLAAGLISAGMNWRQALATILIGNVIVLAPILANSHPGTKYGIPFPVFARASYGVFGANVPAIMRAIVACGWFGINAWIGGQALQTFFRSVWPAWPTLLGGAPDPASSWLFGGHHPTEWVSFLLFWALNILIVYKGMELVRKVENWAAPYVLVMTALLVWWAVAKAKERCGDAPGCSGLGTIMQDEGKFKTFAEFWPVFVPSVTAMIGFWSTLSLNMPDFTRFGRSQREQAVGQVVALPTTMTVFAMMGIVITSASAVIYGQAIWDPVELVGRFENRLVVAVSMFTVVVATLGVNIAANVVSPANDFANIKPGKISFKTGGLITGVLGILMLPWKLIADPNGYIFKWLLGYSGGLGSIAGVLVADYWLVRRAELRLADLYRRDGLYAYGEPAGNAAPAAAEAAPAAYREASRRAGERVLYRGSGVNTKALVATGVGCALAWVGLVVKPLAVLYDYAWFVGAFGAAGAYELLMWGERRRFREGRG
ncbi:MAG TPA: NCS1 family nucleobase:cation symporter-1 [Polyangiaceae bacterium]|nr:NCS1 family nucleobase:cation symporter-1 [Polyangiaceae bacterium]